MKVFFLLKRHQLAAATTEDIFRFRGRHGCSSCRSPPPPQSMVAATMEVAANVVEAALNPTPRHILAASHSPPLIVVGKKGTADADDKGNCVLGVWGDFDDIGLLANIASTVALTAGAVAWSGLREGRGRGFGENPCDRCMVLRDLLIGPSEASVLDHLPIWELVEVILDGRRAESGGNDDDHLRGEEPL